MMTTDSAYSTARWRDLFAPLAMLAAGILWANVATAQPTRKTIGDLTNATSVAATDEVACYQTGGYTKACTLTQISSFATAFGQYDPHTPPASCAACDEFTSGESLTWTWGNQDSSTVTADLSSLKIVGDSTVGLHARGTDSPSAGNVDFTITVAFHTRPNGTTSGCAIALIEAGTIATPTELTILQLVDSTSTDGAYLVTATDYDFGGAAAVGSTLSVDLTTQNIDLTFLQLRYVDSSRSTTGYYSKDGYDWIAVGSATVLSADPAYWVIASREDATCRFLWARARTDDLTSAGE